MKLKISIVIPCYNEAIRIAKNLQTVKDFVKTQPFEFEIIAVNDGSKDKTAEIIQNTEGIIPVIYHDNHGKGYALRQGVAKATGDYIYLCDADLSTPIEKIKDFLDEIPKYDCVIGSRAKEKAAVHTNWYRWLLGRMGNFLIDAILRLSIKDTQCGFKMFTKEVKDLFLACTIDRWGYDFEFLYALKKNKKTVKEIPVQWDATGDTRVKPSAYITTLLDLVSIWWKYR